MKKSTKIALAVALIGGMSATALTASTAMARGGYSGQDCGPEQSQGWRGHKGDHKGGWKGKRGKGGPAKMLKQFDTNKDGTLTKEEVTAGIDKKIADNDKDGDKAVSLEEFKAEWAKITSERMVRAFQRMDRDGSGKVTAEELKTPALEMFDRMDRNDDGKLSKEDRKSGRFGKWFGNGQQEQKGPQGPKGNQS